MTLPIIALTGPAGVGKDSLAEVLRTRHGFAVLAHADPIKVIARDVWGCDPADLWGPSERRALPVPGQIPVAVCYGDDPGPLGPSAPSACGWWGPPAALLLPATADGAMTCPSCGKYARPTQRTLTIRALLQYLGTEIGRNLDPGVWVRKLGRRIDALCSWGLVPLHSGDERLWDTRDADGTFWPSAPTPSAAKALHWLTAASVRGIVVTDMRFDNEADALRTRAHVVHLQRGEGWPARAEVPGGIAGHVSEGGVTFASCDTPIMVPFVSHATDRAFFWDTIANLVTEKRQ